MAYIFKSGNYEGKSIEQVALTDYAHLERIMYYKKRMRDLLSEDIRHVSYNLNNFIPVVKCNEKECDKTSEYLTIYLHKDWVDIKIDGMPKKVYKPTGISVSPNYSWCNSHKTRAEYLKAKPYQIKFEILAEFPAHPKWVRETIEDVLLQCAGFNGHKKTKKNCEDFINSLKLKGQTDFFKNLGMNGDLENIVIK